MTLNWDVEFKAFDDSAWSGSAGQWDTAEAYCADCLIDENPAGQKKIKDKCHLPFRKPGSNAINKGALRAMATGHGLSAVQASAASKKKAAAWVARHWQAAFGKPAPDAVRRMAGMSMSSAKLYKDANDATWFFGIYSNNFEDREQETFSWKSHEEYAQWVRESKVVPQVTVFHQPKIPDLLWGIAYAAYDQGEMSTDQFNEFIRTVYKDYAIAETRAVIPLNGFMLVIGKVYPDKQEAVQKLMTKEMDWGMSHGFISLNDSDNIIDMYRSFEFTLLPKERAANRVTLGGFKGVTMDDKNVREEDQALIDEIFGTGAALKTEEATKRAKELLSAVLSSKALKEGADAEVEAAEQETPDTEEAPAEETQSEETQTTEVVEEKALPVDYEALRQKLFADLNVEGLNATLKTMGETLATLAKSMETTTANVKALGTKMEKLDQDDDVKIAAQLTPNAPFQWPGVAAKQVEQKSEQEEDLAARLKEAPPSASEEPSDADPLYRGFYRYLGH